MTLLVALAILGGAWYTIQAFVYSHHGFPYHALGLILVASLCWFGAFQEAFAEKQEVRCELIGNSSCVKVRIRK